ncbi:MAG TPA: endolytic transglycosylase MltG [Dermatophilaceae bacterium]|nr:endolytic transglycosylase MltG [Dermatophilaceae bacterium]
MTEQHLEHSIFGGDDQRPRRRRPRRPTRRAWRLLVLLLTIGLVAGAGAVAWGAVGPMVRSVTSLGGDDKPTDYPGPGTGSVTVTVEEGDSGEDIASTLKDAGVVRTRTAYLQASAANPEATARIQPGTYALRTEMQAVDAFTYLTDPANRTNPSVTLPEGLWASETYARLAKATGTPVADYAKAAKDADAIGLPPEAKGNAEGWLFPSTYQFEEGESAADQLATLVTRAKKEFATTGLTGKKLERTLVIASIVEAEVNRPVDRAKVARVIENRLATGKPAGGPLQMDSTVHFAVRERGRAGTTPAQRASDSPYNTYRVAGLPPGPIGNPGMASVKAAADPAAGSWIFFVTVDPDTGETKFATTQAEHERNVAEFQRWCSANPDAC